MTPTPPPGPPVESASLPSVPSDTGNVVPLPPPTQPEEGQPPARARSGSQILDGALVGTVLLFAFLLASFPVRNSDFWLHLASGRLLVTGQYHFGVDPFAFTTEGVYWVNQAWLFDGLLYLLYQALGGTVLVILKAGLVATLACLLLSIRLKEQSLAWPVTCTCLALLAMSPRLLLGPTLLSLLFLALTLWLLGCPSLTLPARTLPSLTLPAPGWRGDPGFARQLRYHAPLLGLFVVWVNVDDWFWLGPLLLALFWLGGRLRKRADPSYPRVPGWLVPVSLVLPALLNPHLIWAFTVPAELRPLLSGTGIPEDVRFQHLFGSPWNSALPLWPPEKWNLSALAYFALVFLGGISFLVCRQPLFGWRLTVWVGFALLGAWQGCLVPFFAVVAAPITALNLQQRLTRPATSEPEGPAPDPSEPEASAPETSEPEASATDAKSAGTAAGGVGARLLVLAGCLALLACTWMGRLYGFDREARRVNWAVEPDPSLVRVCQTLQGWHQEGQLKEGRGFAFHPALVHYYAWFCPQEKGFYDQRGGLFPTAVIRDYERACRSLVPHLDPGASSPPTPDWEKIFTRWGIDYVVLYDPQQGRLLSALPSFAQDERWTLLRVDGQALIFWHKGEGNPAGLTPLEPAREVFVDPAGEGQVPAAPERGPARGPHLMDLGRYLQLPGSVPPWESAAASVYLRLLPQRPSRTRQRRTRKRGPGEPGALLRQTGQALGLWGQGCRLAGPWATATDLAGYLYGVSLESQDPEGARTALLLLALRAARNALGHDPDDATALLRLGQAYFTLHRQALEAQTAEQFSPLATLRQIQIATALEGVLRRNPDVLVAHQVLALLYGQRHFLDAALIHRRAELRLTRAGGPLPSENPEAFAQRLKGLEQSVQALEREVQDRLNLLVIRTEVRELDSLGQARLALELGLARHALEEVLLKSNVLLFGSAGARLEMRLMLSLGQAEAVGLQLQDEQMRASKAKLGYLEFPVRLVGSETIRYRLPAYEWLLTCQGAASGDYTLAASALQAMGKEMEQGVRRGFHSVRGNLPGVLVSELGLGAHPATFLIRVPLRTLREGLSQLLRGSITLQRERADLHVLAALLALEQGDPALAQHQLEQALLLCPPGGWPEGGFASQALAHTYWYWMQKARK